MIIYSPIYLEFAIKSDMQTQYYFPASVCSLQRHKLQLLQGMHIKKLNGELEWQQ